MSLVHKIDGYDVEWKVLDDDFDEVVMMEAWSKDGKIHREGKPAIVYKSINSGRILGEEYYCRGKLHRVDGPARIRESDGMRDIEYFQNGRHHRLDGPAHISIALRTGIIHYEVWKKDGSLHRGDDLPAKIHRDENTGIAYQEKYFVNDLQHRENGPAEIERCPDSGVAIDMQYYLNGLLHRADGPAIIQKDPETGMVLRTEFFVGGQPAPQWDDTAPTM